MSGLVQEVISAGGAAMLFGLLVEGCLSESLPCG